MADGNPLIAHADKSDSQASWSNFADTMSGGVGTDVSAIKNVAENVGSPGAWAVAGLDVAGTALNTAAMASDPIGTLISNGLSFVLDHLNPPKEWMDKLAGNPGEVGALAETWNNVAKSLNEQASQLSHRVSSDLGHMTGDAVDAYRNHADQLVQSLEAMSVGASASASAYQKASDIVAVVHELVVTGLSQVVGSIISYAAEFVCSLGLATPLIIEQVDTRIADLVSEIGSKVTGAVESCRNLSGLVEDLGHAFEHVHGTLSKMGDKVTGLSNKMDSALGRDVKEPSLGDKVSKAMDEGKLHEHAPSEARPGHVHTRFATKKLYEHKLEGKLHDARDARQGELGQHLSGAGDHAAPNAVDRLRGKADEYLHGEAKTDPQGHVVTDEHGNVVRHDGPSGFQAMRNEKLQDAALKAAQQNAKVQDNEATGKENPGYGEDAPES